MTTEDQKLLYKALCYSLPYDLQFKGKRKGWISFCSGKMTLTHVDFDGRFEIIKPYYRSLDKLTTEIEHNGERFIPLQWLYENLEDHEVIRAFLGHLEYADIIRIELCPIVILEKLLEWHFNLFLPKELYIEKL